MQGGSPSVPVLTVGDIFLAQGTRSKRVAEWYVGGCTPGWSSFLGFAPLALIPLEQFSNSTNPVANTGGAESRNG